jgi:Plavaka transposase
MYHHDIIECIHTLYGDPEFCTRLVFKLERHYIDQNMTEHIYNDMYIGEWWWSTQVCNCFHVYINVLD